MKLSLTNSIDIGAGIDLLSRPYDEALRAEDNRLRQYNGYDAAEDSTKRRVPNAKILTEDEALPEAKRKKLQANAIDIKRNFAIAGWAIRKHLDFVTSFSFASNNAQTSIGRDADAAAAAEQAERSQLDDDIVGIIDEASAAENCDSAGRHDLQSMLRIAESLATLTGDIGLLEISDGTMQGIEGDRVRSPSGDKTAVHGIRLDGRGRAAAYAVHRRKGSGGYEFERWVPAANMIWHGFLDRWDQVRGVSPMAPSLNTLRDVYEGFDHALAKAKLAQLFGFKLMRNASNLLNQQDDEEGERPSYKVSGGKGPWFLDLERGDDAEIMQAEVPGDSFQAYSELMIAVSMLALDLPWNFFKVDATNFFGSRAALNLYLKSVKPKRRRTVTILKRWTQRQLALAVARGRLRLPRSLELSALRWSWTADGLPWWNPSQEADGALKSIGAALNNPQDLCLETGTNFFSNVDKIAECQRYAESKGVTLSFAVPSSITIEQP